MKYKLIFFLVFLVIGISVTKVHSQQSTDSLKYLKQFEKHSLQFRISGSFRLLSFQGAFFSYKYHFSDKHAFRAGISVSTFDLDRDSKRKSIEKYPSSIENMYSYSINRDETQYTYSLSLFYLYYLKPDQNINFYTGAGPFIGGNKYRINYNNNYPERFDRNEVYTLKTYNIGVSCLYGIEWFFRNNMSLMAEYGFYFYYYYYNYEKFEEFKYLPENHFYEDKYLGDAIRDGWRFDDTAVKLGISVYL
ncbi:MAG: hypothetical protein JXR46_09400 [Calditrichaceae bacterium]|nr:hypothetical protein [Calditrichaceae bacterium]MBN2709247.1 hypothetical protein [Calditrichaceae bacterium]RQV96200.1 MAG: hypothetical protein EH224_05710 [Calditrichota bacterium]